MSAVDAGGPAFPGSGPSYPQPSGMTLRDYFAAKAMPALITEWGRVILHMDGKDFSGLNIVNNGGGTPTSIAEEAYAMADEMLEARK